jgi:hypothetical protein
LEELAKGKSPKKKRVIKEEKEEELMKKLKILNKDNPLYDWGPITEEDIVEPEPQEEPKEENDDDLWEDQPEDPEDSDDPGDNDDDSSSGESSSEESSEEEEPPKKPTKPKKKPVKTKEKTVKISKSSIKLPIPGKFDGYRPEVEQWLFAMEQYLTIADYEEKKWVQFSAMMMTESAAVWWREVWKKNTQPKHWKSFKKQLTQQFKTIDEKRLARDKLANLRQLTSVQEYIKEFRVLKYKIPDLSKEEEFDKFRRGLKMEIQNEMDRRRIKEDINNLMESAQEYDVLLFRRITHGLIEDQDKDKDIVQVKIVEEENSKGNHSEETTRVTDIQEDSGNLIHHSRKELMRFKKNQRETGKQIKHATIVVKKAT